MGRAATMDVHPRRSAPTTVGLVSSLLILGGAAGVMIHPRAIEAAFPRQARWTIRAGHGPVCPPGPCPMPEPPGGTWYWLRSPEQERRVVIGLYNRYCIRCHGVDGRGVWDIPDVPDFTNARWQASRPDPYLVRVIVEGRGAVMPPFRGTLTLEESWALTRYLRTFLPGTAVPRPDRGPETGPRVPAPTAPETPTPEVDPPPPPSPSAAGPFARPSGRGPGPSDEAEGSNRTTSSQPAELDQP